MSESSISNPRLPDSSPARPSPYDSYLDFHSIPLTSESSAEPDGQNSRLNNTHSSSPPQSSHKAVSSPPESTPVTHTSSISARSTTQRKVYIGPWELGRTVGRGGCSRVRMVRNRYTGQLGAAKIISKSGAEQIRAMSLANLDRNISNGGYMLSKQKVMPLGLEREIVIMKLLDHPNIVKLFDVWENRNELYIIMQYVEGGELFDYIESRRGLSESEAVFLFRQVIEALIYCHKINIHHRDLKPENILLDPETYSIKLVDFGMAALQPKGQYLSTPCGSPHYAAPELLINRPYDGAQSDVWSCGVILYVMLTGSPPFNFPPEDTGLSDENRLKALYTLICNADYSIPSAFSSEVRDLIQKIFVVNPKQRITMEQMWYHPLLHKYDSQYGFDPAATTESLPSPSLDVNWIPLTRFSIDREILRNMRTLWHSEKEDKIVERLLNDEDNQEKFFYAALLKNREEQLENYAGYPSGLVYSPSDYQHLSPFTQDLNRNSLLPAGSEGGRSIAAPRSKSQYSILNDEHLHSRFSLYPSRLSEQYDKDNNRKSRTGWSVISESAFITDPCGGNQASPNHTSDGVGVSRPKAKILKQRPPTSASLGRPTLLKPTSPRNRTIVQKCSNNSLSSVNIPSSPPALPLKMSTPVKRPVQFVYNRKKSSAAGSPFSCGPASERPGSYHTVYSQTSSESLVSSPNNPLPTADESTTAIRASSMPLENNDLGEMRPPSPTDRPASLGAQVETITQKLSTDLEKFCEDAFFGSSLESSMNNLSILQTGMEKRPDTPPTSISSENSGPALFQPSPNNPNQTCWAEAGLPYHGPILPFPAGSVGNKNDPSLTPETPKTFANRQILETREKLMAKWAESNGNDGYFRDIITQLDNLLQTSSLIPSSLARTVSAPPIRRALEYEHSNMVGYLPVIDEESKHTDTDDETTPTVSVCTSLVRKSRVVTEPIRRTTASPVGDIPPRPETTIRLVESPSSGTGTRPSGSSIPEDKTAESDTSLSNALVSISASSYTPRTVTVGPISVHEFNDDLKAAPESAHCKSVGLLDDSSRCPSADVCGANANSGRPSSARPFGPKIQYSSTGTADARCSSSLSGHRTLGKKRSRFWKRYGDKFKDSNNRRSPSALGFGDPWNQGSSQESQDGGGSNGGVGGVGCSNLNTPHSSKRAAGTGTASGGGGGLFQFFRRKKTASPSLGSYGFDDFGASARSSSFCLTANGNGSQDFSSCLKTSQFSPCSGGVGGSCGVSHHHPYPSHAQPQHHHLRQNSQQNSHSYSPPFAEVQINWLTRLLHVKPVSHSVCLQVSRTDGMKELVEILQNWRQYGGGNNGGGIEIYWDDANNTIEVNISRKNAFKLKPVIVVIELFTVLENQKEVGLCLARFTQNRGAASSFRKVADEVEGVLVNKGLVVEDEEKAKGMRELLVW